MNNPILSPGQAGTLKNGRRVTIQIKKSRLKEAENEQKRIEKSAMRRLSIAKASAEADRLIAGASTDALAKHQLVADIEAVVGAWHDPCQETPDFGKRQQGPRMVYAGLLVEFASRVFWDGAPDFIPSTQEILDAKHVARDLTTYFGCAELEDTTGVATSDGLTPENSLERSTRQLSGNVLPGKPISMVSRQRWNMLEAMSSRILRLENVLLHFKESLSIAFSPPLEELTDMHLELLRLNKKAKARGYSSHRSYLFEVNSAKRKETGESTIKSKLASAEFDSRLNDL